MKRRGFLASLFAGAGAIVASKRAQAAPQPLPEPEPVDLPEDLRVPASVLPGDGTSLAWKEPVERARDLPMLADEGDACFVLNEDRCYIAAIDEPEKKLVDVNRVELWSGFEKMKSEAEARAAIDHVDGQRFGVVPLIQSGEDAATKAYVDGVALKPGDGVLLGPGRPRRPGHWIPFAGAGS